MWASATSLEAWFASKQDKTGGRVHFPYKGYRCYAIGVACLDSSVT